MNFLNFSRLFLTAVRMRKLRKAHCSPPLVDKDNSMVFTSHSVPFHFLHTSDGKQILISKFEHGFLICSEMKKICQISVLSGVTTAPHVSYCYLQILPLTEKSKNAMMTTWIFSNLVQFACFWSLL